MGTRGSARRTSTWAVQRGLALLALAVSGLSCTLEREQPAEEARAQARLVHEQQVAAVHARLVEEHGAILFPPQSFRQKRVFTYHLEQLLIRPDARPTLFDARLDDLGAPTIRPGRSSTIRRARLRSTSCPSNFSRTTTPWWRRSTA